MNELKLLGAMIQSRETWHKIRSYARDYLSPQTLIVQDCIDDYYKADRDAKSVDPELLETQVLRRVANPKHQATFSGLLHDIPDDISAENITREVLEVARETCGGQLAQSLLNKEIKQCGELAKKYLELTEATELTENDQYKVHAAISMVELIPKADKDARIPLFPKVLNDRLNGGCLPGDHVLVFARPETGKTASALNFCRGIAKSGRRVLYCSNEDSMERLLVRAKASFADMDYDKCLESPEEADSKAAEAGFGNVIFVEMYPGTVHQIEDLVKEYQPDVLIVDQLINLVGKKSDNYTLQLGAVARGIRNLAKHYGIVAISYAQAGDSADNKLVLDLGDVNWSNTDLQGAVDLMIGIGVNAEFNSRNWRMISLCKNKLSGKHDYFPVKIDPIRSRLASLKV